MDASATLTLAVYVKAVMADKSKAQEAVAALLLVRPDQKQAAKNAKAGDRTFGPPIAAKLLKGKWSGRLDSN
jgi:hypothetical protein